MTFTVTYRDKTGAKCEEAIEAASRAGCVEECRRRGIAPTGIREGGRPRGPHRAAADGRGKARPSQDGTRGRSPSHGSRRILAVLGTLAILGGGAWWWLASRQESAPYSPPEKPRSTAMPKEVAPARRTKTASPEKPKKITHKASIPRTPEEQLAWIRKKYGDNIPENLKTTVYFLEHPPTQTYKPLPQPEDVFKHQSEKTIAAVLLMKPGTFVMRRTVYDESFDDDFKRAMAEPTEIEDDDSEETKELKAAVKEVKDEWAEKMRAGGKPSEIMTEVMNTAYELGKYSRQIEEMLHETVDDPSMSDNDVEDFVKAANTLLKEKGLDEIETPNLLRRQARLRRIARKAQEQQEQKDVK